MIYLENLLSRVRRIRISTLRIETCSPNHLRNTNSFGKKPCRMTSYEWMKTLFDFDIVRTVFFQKSSADSFTDFCRFFFHEIFRHSVMLGDLVDTLVSISYCRANRFYLKSLQWFLQTFFRGFL